MKEADYTASQETLQLKYRECDIVQMDVEQLWLVGCQGKTEGIRITHKVTRD
jgi:hypothetical protein